MEPTSLHWTRVIVHSAFAALMVLCSATILLANDHLYMPVSDTLETSCGFQVSVDFPYGVATNDTTIQYCGETEIVIHPNTLSWPESEQWIGTIITVNNQPADTLMVGESLDLGVLSSAFYDVHIEWLVQGTCTGITSDYTLIVRPALQVSSPNVNACSGDSLPLSAMVNDGPVSDFSLITNPDLTYLPDILDVPISSILDVQTNDMLDTWHCGDTLAIALDIEHSFARDIDFFLTCPNGTSVHFVKRSELFVESYGFGHFADDWTLATQGNGFLYTWSTGGTVATPSNVIQDSWYVLGTNTTQMILDPSIVYAPFEDFCLFDGCPINGNWKLEIIDNLSLDDGNLFSWSLFFGPEYPELYRQYQPSLGQFEWTGSTLDTSVIGSSLMVDASAPSANTYLVSYTSDIGCTADTTVAVTVFDRPFEVYAGEDFYYFFSNNQLHGEILLQTDCQWDSTFTFCYGDNANDLIQWCLSDVSSCTGPLQMTIEQGEVEGSFDTAFIYDVVDGQYQLMDVFQNGGTTNTFVSSSQGCLALGIVSDFSASCTGGQYDPLQIRLSTVLPYNFQVEWSPGENLSNPSIYSPQIVETPTNGQNFIFTATIEQTVQCSSSDTVLVDVVPFQVNGLVYNDDNANGVFDENEYGLRNVQMLLSTGEIVLTDAEGRFSASQPWNTEAITLLENDQLWLTTSPLTQQTQLSPANPNAQLEWARTASQPIMSADVSGGRYATYCENTSEGWFQNIVVTNTGNVAGSFVVRYEPDLGVAINDAVPAGTLDSNFPRSMFWTLENVQPTQAVTIKVKLDATALQTGDLHGALVQVKEQNGTWSDILEEGSIVVNYDCEASQLKECTSFYSSEHLLTLGSDLHYQLLGVNTSIAATDSVWMFDLLPTEVDPLSFRIMASSVPCVASIEGQAVSFSFPDLTLQPEERVWVQYAANVREDVPAGTNVANSANVFAGDSNMVLLTSEVQLVPCDTSAINLVYDGQTLRFEPSGFATGVEVLQNNNLVYAAYELNYEVPTPAVYTVNVTLQDGCALSFTKEVTVGVNELSSPIDVRIYPTIAHEVVEWRSLHGMHHIRVLDAHGRTMVDQWQTASSGQIDVSAFAAGVYLVWVNEHVQRIIHP